MSVGTAYIAVRVIVRCVAAVVGGSDVEKGEGQNRGNSCEELHCG